MQYKTKNELGGNKDTVVVSWGNDKVTEWVSMFCGDHISFNFQDKVNTELQSNVPPEHDHEGEE